MEKIGSGYATFLFLIRLKFIQRSEVRDFPAKSEGFLEVNNKSYT